MKQVLVVGCGCTGASAARFLAERGFSVTVIDQRMQPGGNAYDCMDENGIWIHPYGPHIFFTDKEPVWRFLSDFSAWDDYRPAVRTFMRGAYFDMPFNLSAFEQLLPPQQAREMIAGLQTAFQGRESVSVMELMETREPMAREAARLLYEADYLPYNQKQWGLRPEELAGDVLRRAPVRLTYDTAFKKHRYQAFPSDGFCALFARMLEHPLIRVWYGTRANQVFSIQGDTPRYRDQAFDMILYTGMVDALFEEAEGALPYRTLAFTKQVCRRDAGLPCLAAYYPETAYPYTRKTDYQYLPQNRTTPLTAVIAEEPRAYCAGEDQETPFYVQLTPASQALYQRYRQRAGQVQGLWLAGRLADFRYYNMDDAVARGLEVAREMITAQEKGGNSNAVPYQRDRF